MVIGRLLWYSLSNDCTIVAIQYSCSCVPGPGLKDAAAQLPIKASTPFPAVWPGMASEGWGWNIVSTKEEKRTATTKSKISIKKDIKYKQLCRSLNKV